MKKCFLPIYFFLLVACGSNQDKADLIFHNAVVYTVNKDQPSAQAVAIKDGNILKVGSNKDVLAIKAKREIDAKGQFVMPGFTDGHAHFMGIGESLQNINSLDTKSWDEVVQQVKKKVAEVEPGEWITGRGWHQEKWIKTTDRTYKGFPYHDALSLTAPDNPVVLRHASGHGLIANLRAMELAEITSETIAPEGGEILIDEEGNLTGVFQENAMELFDAVQEQYLKNRSKEEINKQKLKTIRLAEQECLSKGLTGLHDAGALFSDVNLLHDLAMNDDLNLRLYIMLSSGSAQPLTAENLSDYPIQTKNSMLTCGAIKAYSDGALGSRGAWLLKDYTDDKGNSGQSVTPLEDLKAVAELAKQKDLQLCIHAIGDRANREVINIFKEVHGYQLKEKRWRIEHAQHLNPGDIDRIADLGIIASMQSVHCTSDSPYVEKRLGEKRAEEGAYVWQTLLQQGVTVANGTDAPVEDVSPIANFYSAVTRKRSDNGFEFYTDQKMTREQAIYSLTMANAYAGFQEDILGSIEEGKLADIVILSNNLIECSDADILDTKVMYTIVGGKIRYETSAEK